MKLILKLEELALLLLFSFLYFRFYEGSIALYASLFFVPDLAFLLYPVSKKAMIILYNILHHKGVMILLLFIGYVLHNDILLKTGLIFLAHSSFDRVAGYGLKFIDNPDHTHLGWVGKSRKNNPML